MLTHKIHAKKTCLISDHLPTFADKKLTAKKIQIAIILCRINSVQQVHLVNGKDLTTAKMRELSIS